jgi:hypothetical protein
LSVLVQKMTDCRIYTSEGQVSTCWLTLLTLTYRSYYTERSRFFHHCLITLTLKFTIVIHPICTFGTPSTSCPREPLLALFDIKRYINPAIASALYIKKALYYLYQRQALHKPIFVVVTSHFLSPFLSAFFLFAFSEDRITLPTTFFVITTSPTFIPPTFFFSNTLATIPF